MKKIFSILLALCMLLTLLPQNSLTAFAGMVAVMNFEELKDAINLADDGGKIWIGAEINVTETLAITKSLTLTTTGSGKLIRDSSFTDDSMFNINGTGKTVTFKNITIDGNNVGANEPGITVTAGELIFDDGAVLQNCIPKSFPGMGMSMGGGGVLISSGKFTMNAGSSITNNTGDSVGGVSVMGGSFLMNGGIISNNSTRDGGGVNLYSGSFEMNGGNITFNNASNTGGGIYAVNDTQFIMSGGSITNNTATNWAGGVYLHPYCDTQFSGDIQIKDNLKSGGIKDNLYLYSGNIALTGALASTAVIGVTMNSTPTSGSPITVAVGDAGYSAGVSSDDAAKFTSDSDSYRIGYDSTNKKVILEVNVAVDVVINEATQIVTYNGSPQAFVPTGTPSTGFTVLYMQGGSAVTPTAVGTYDVEITRAADTSYKAYSKTILNGLLISKATPTINTPPTAAGIVGGTTLSTSVLSGGSASVPGTFSWTNGSTIPAAGTNSYSVTFTPSDSDNYNTVTTTVPITVPTAPAISAILSQPSILAGDDLNSKLTKPTVTDNGYLIELQGWQSSPDGTTGWQDIPVSSTCTAAMNGYYVRYYVCYRPSGGDLTVVYSPNTRQLTINRHTATLTLTVVPASPQIFGTAVTLKATITGSSLVLTSQGYLNTVPVTFKDDMTTLGTATLTTASGTAIFTTSDLSIGNHTLTAEFPGESDYYTPATSNVVNYSIQATTYTGGNSGGSNPGSPSTPVQSGSGKSEGTVVKDRQQSDGAPAASVNNSGEELKTSILTPQEQELVAQGEDVRVILKVVDISASISVKEKQLIDEALNKTNTDTGIPALYVDLSLYKQIGDRDQTRITETNGKISVSIEVPESLWSTDAGITRSFYIIRIHENEAIRINGTYDQATHLFTFETDRFSTYALTYQDVNTFANPGNNTTNPPAPSQDFHHLRLTAKAATNTLTLTYAKISDADGYLIYGAKCGQKLVKLKDVDKTVTSYTMKGLKAATYYKYQVKAYKIVNEKRVLITTSKVVHSVTESKLYGNPAKITSKVASVKLSAGKSKTVTCQVVLPEGKKQKEHTAVIRYESSNGAIATVNNKGRITAKAKGTCYVYAYAQNGVYKKIKVTVK